MSSEDFSATPPRDPMDRPNPLDSPPAAVPPAGVPPATGWDPEGDLAATYPGGTTAGTTPPASQQEPGMVAAGKETAQHVGETASEEARKVTQEAKTQAKSLLSDLQTDLRDQAGKQQERIAGNLRSMSDEFNTMMDASSGGQGAELVGMAGRRVEQVAEWLENRDPGTMLEDVRRFARRRPGAFLAIAAGAGLVAGRLARNLAADAGTQPSGSGGPAAPGPVRPSVPPSAWPADATTTSGAVGTSPAGGAGMTPPGAMGSTLPPANPTPGSSETYP
ncbi:hypothetical protein [Zafaria cholistanensis]|nr:hypothetical protein [Zafaria cholistanensis]